MVALVDLITRAYGRIGVLGDGEPLSASQAQLGLDDINALLDQWKAEDLLVYAIRRTTATLTASQASFTVGTGGNINISRPTTIDHVNYVDNSVSPAVEYSLGELLTEQEWEGIAVKGQTATRPSRAYYEPTYPTGTLYPWPIPTTSSLLWAIYYHAVVDEFEAISDDVDLPPAYRRMLVTNLAMELIPAHDRDAHPVLVQQARESKGVVKRKNQTPRELSFEAAALVQNVGWFDVTRG